MSEKRTTVKDIASRMGISLSTVNKALTGKPGISETRRAEVLAVAKEMGYVVNHVAQSLSRKPIKIGIIIPSVWEEYFGLVERGIRIELEKLSQENVTGIFHYVKTAADIHEAFVALIDSKADIILYCPFLTHAEPDTCAYLKDKHVPVFIIGDEYSELDSVCSVVVNPTLSGHMAADFLKLFLSENDPVAVFAGSGEMRAHANKAEAFLLRAKDLGLDPVGVYETMDDPEVTHNCIRQMLQDVPDVKGIYVATATAPAVTSYYREHPELDRPHIVATDIYEDIRQEMVNGSISAAIYQNQVLTGRVAIKMAYRYLVGITSYSASPEEFSKKIYVNPHLFLPSNLESLTLDNGSDYTLA